MHLKHSPAVQLLIEFKEEGKSKFLSTPEWMNLLVINIPVKFTFYNMLMETKKYGRNCNKNNDQYQFHCIQKYLAKGLGNCTLPWLKEYSELQLCQNSTKELNLYFSKLMKVLKRKSDSELEKMGCLEKNCIEHTWTSKVVFVDDNEIIYTREISMVNESLINLNTFSDEVR